MVWSVGTSMLSFDDIPMKLWAPQADQAGAGSTKERKSQKAWRWKLRWFLIFKRILISMRRSFSTWTYRHRHWSRIWAQRGTLCLQSPPPPSASSDPTLACINTINITITISTTTITTSSITTTITIITTTTIGFFLLLLRPAPRLKKCNSFDLMKSKEMQIQKSYHLWSKIAVVTVLKSPNVLTINILIHLSIS